VSITGIRNEPLSLDELIADVSHDASGAVASFLGVVRNHNDGLTIERLDYHVYEAMAEKELAAIAAEVEAELPGVRVACTHRVGELRIGDAAIACAASAAHRAEAFQACRAVVDRVKARVPIWKKEHGPEGPYWVGWQDARVGPEGSKGQGG
jgi:molybdopterin synthase catalytic subunit